MSIIEHNPDRARKIVENRVFLSANKGQLSARGAEWVAFAARVLRHIEDYTVPQYGDAPGDQVEEWSPEECVLTIRKYAARFRKNSRPGQDALDLVKVAHYACLALGKLETENDE